MRALVIDDSRTAREILSDMLGDLGFEVLKAQDGREGLRCLKEAGPVDVVLVDWIMPELDGIEFIRAVRADEGQRELLIMMVTSQTDMPEVASALEAGADEYVMKPVTREMMVEKLNLLGITVR
jgi:two-component system chemotaxis response regulator CheY